MIEYIILGALLYKDLTAYKIKKGLSDSVQFFYSMSFGSLIPILKKLEKKGFVTCKTTVENGRTQKIYHMENSGKEALREWLMRKSDISKVRDEGLLKMFFIHEIPAEERKNVFVEYIENLEDQIKTLETVEKKFDLKEIPEEFHGIVRFRLKTLEFGKDYYRFVADWYQKFIDDCLKDL